MASDVEDADEFAASHSSKGRATAARVAELEAENARLQKQLGLVDAYHAAAGTPPEWLRLKRKPSPSAGTACLQFSDWHLDEIVDPGEVGGINAYNREIARQRLARWALEACEKGDQLKRAVVWDGAVIFSDGDLVSGAIHEELVETNDDVLPGTIVYWAPLIAAAYKTVADFYGRLHVTVVVGNHGRLTKKKQAKRRGRNSWDWLLMQFVRSHLADDPRFTWEFSPGSCLFVPIYGDYVFQTHGDEVGGGSGWSGIWTPLATIHRKGIELAAARGIRIVYSVIGHWHSTTRAYERGIAGNGSGKGYDEFATSLRLTPEPAMQNYSVHTPRNRVTFSSPLLLEDRRAEGW